MKFKEIKHDLFLIDNDAILAHCISADCAMGRGIAWEFQDRFTGIKRKIKALNPAIGKALPYEDYDSVTEIKRVVLNLVTKQNYYDKPTYITLAESLISLLTYMELNNYRKLAIPRIGCGLDGLEWSRVSKIIKQVFAETDIEIIVCNKN